MNNDEKRIAIAEFCLPARTDGIVEYQRFDSFSTGFFQRVKCPDRTGPSYTGKVPDYPNDLNAINEAVAKLSPTLYKNADGFDWSDRHEFIVQLERIVQGPTGIKECYFDVINATAEQRCDALLCVIEKGTP